MQVEGPIDPNGSLPFGSARVEGTTGARLLEEYGYIEEEYFISGRADVLGTRSFGELEAGEHFFMLKPLAGVARPDVPYTSRVLVIRPQRASDFSGIAQVIPVHVLTPLAVVDENVLRNGDAWIGVEVNDGARYGTDVIPSGGVASLRRADPDRYRDLSVSGGDPEAWGLPDDLVAKAWENMAIQGHTPEHEILAAEMFRTLAQGTGILVDVAIGLKLGDGSVLPGFDVRRVYTAGASGNSLIANSLVDGQHDAKRLPDGRPAFDGYFISVGLQAGISGRPRDAVVVVVESENEVLLWKAGADALGGPADNTDDPRFRYYEFPGTGHRISVWSADVLETRSKWNVTPPGIQGLSAIDGEGHERYDKFNQPFIWALWRAMYEWVDDGVPMPRVDPITRDPNASDGLARDEHGNALGGFRTPWVEVPDATYYSQRCPEDSNSGGMDRFAEEKMTELYGSHDEYRRRVLSRLDEMIEQRLLLPEDRDRVLPPNA